MKNKEGIAKNIEVVKGQFEDCAIAIQIQIHKGNSAWQVGEYFRAIHHYDGIREEIIDQMPRFWYYTQIPRWLFIVWLVVA